MAVDPHDDTPRPLAEICEATGVTRGTLVRWIDRDPGLRTTTDPGGRPFVSYKELVSFAEANRRLRAARKVMLAVEGGGRAIAPGRMPVADLLDALIKEARLHEEIAINRRQQLERVRAALDPPLP